jgi:membrane fusion protein (multidrug efflux system)
VRSQAVLVPQQGVGRDPKGNPFAWVVGKDQKVELRPLELERAIGDQWLVMSGLAIDDRVIVEGVDRVRPGMPVIAVPFAGGGTPPAQGRPGPKAEQNGGGHV